MNKIESFATIKTIKREYFPYYPSQDCETDVWVRYLKDAMDAEEAERDGVRLFCFELFTERQVSYLYENLQNSDAAEFVLASYTFTAKVPVDDTTTAERIHKLFSDQIVKCKLMNPVSKSAEYSLCLNGFTELAYHINPKYYNEQELPYFCDNVRLCYNEYGPLTDSELITKIHTLIEANQKIEFLPPEWNSGGNSSGGNPSGGGNDSGDKHTIRVQMFSVGSANCTYVKYDNGKSLLIDCGSDRYRPQDYMRSILYIVKNLKPTGIIISHWHIDHYALLNYLDLSDLEIVVVPSKLPKTALATSFLNKIKAKKQVRFFDLSQGTYVQNWLASYGYPKTSMFTGCGSIPSSSSNNFVSLGCGNKENETAIIVRVGTDNKSIIIPSDVSYYNWPNEPELIFKPYQLFIAPHHGGSVYALRPQTSVSFAKIYISSAFRSIKNTHPHFHQTFISQLMGISNRVYYYYSKDYNDSKKYCHMDCKLEYY